MATLRERLTKAGIGPDKQESHLRAGYLGVGGTRVDSLDVEVPDGSWDFGIYPWFPMTPEERAEVEVQLAAGRAARDEKAKPATGFTD